MTHYIASSRGNNLLIDSNYEYTNHHKNADGTISYWRCAKMWFNEPLKVHCRADIQTFGNSSKL